MHAILITFESISPFADTKPLIDAIKKYDALQVSTWAWVIRDYVETTEVFESLRPFAEPNFRLFIVEFIKPKTINPICGDFVFASNG